MSPPIILGAQSVYGEKKKAGWPESHWGSFLSASIIGQWLCARAAETGVSMG